MKKLILLSAIAMSGLVYQNASAQIHFSINLGLRAPVIVQPAPVYDADYYYLPDVEAYYSVSNNCYYYNDGNAWISAAYLPGAYRNYDWRTGNHYAVREARPYLHNDVYRARYGGVEGHRDWNYRNDRSPVYANRDRIDHNQYRGNDHGRSDRPQVQQNDNRGNYGGRNEQPQQNNNRGNGQQQGQPQQGNNRGGNDHGNDNNNGNNNGGRQGRGGRS